MEDTPGAIAETSPDNETLATELELDLQVTLEFGQYPLFTACVVWPTWSEL
jgi:hypothetical protein